MIEGSQLDENQGEGEAKKPGKKRIYLTSMRF